MCFINLLLFHISLYYFSRSHHIHIHTLILIDADINASAVVDVEEEEEAEYSSVLSDTTMRLGLKFLYYWVNVR